MSILSPSQDGAFVFVALQDNATGNQLIFKITRPTSTTPTTVTAYEPGGGTAGNVSGTGNPDTMVFHGNFGTDTGVIVHAIAAATNTDKTPATIGTKKIQPLRVDPSDVDHFVAVNRDDQDALETEDGGTTWATLNAALGVTVDAMGVMFFGSFFPFGAFVGGNDGVDENLSYTPNEFSNLRDDASAGLKAVGSITGIDLVVD